MRKYSEKAGQIFSLAAVFLVCPLNASAHIFDERPGLGARMTVILAVSWICVVLGIILLVRRLMGRDRGKEDIRNGKKDE